MRINASNDLIFALNVIFSQLLDEGVDGKWDRALISLSPGGSDADTTREMDLVTEKFIDPADGKSVATGDVRMSGNSFILPQNESIISSIGPPVCLPLSLTDWSNFPHSLSFVPFCVLFPLDPYCTRRFCNANSGKDVHSISLPR